MMPSFSYCVCGTNNVGGCSFISLPFSCGMRIFYCYGLTDAAIPRPSPPKEPTAFFTPVPMP